MTSAVLAPDAPAVVASRPRAQGRTGYLIGAICIAVDCDHGRADRALRSRLGQDSGRGVGCTAALSAQRS